MSFKQALISSLPQELINEIIEYLSGSITDLGACALIGRRWTTPSRAHLFRDVHLHPGDYERPEETLAVLNSALGTQLSARTLTLSIAKRKAATTFDFDKIDVCSGFMASMLKRMPRLRAITFDRCLLSISPHNPNAHSPLASLQTLAISPPLSYDFRASFSHTLAFFRLTPTTRLELRTYTFGELMYQSTALLKLGVKWKLGLPLAVSAACADALRRWEVGTVVVETLWLLVGMKECIFHMLEGKKRTVLSVGRLTALASPIVDDFWQEVGPRITDLVLEAEYKIDIIGIDASMRWRNFAHCSSLRTLIFPVSPYLTLAAGYRNLFDALADASPTVESVILQLQLRSVADVSIANQLGAWEERMEWDLLRDAITRFHGFKSLSFVVQGFRRVSSKGLESFCLEIEKVVARRLPDLYHKSRVYVPVDVCHRV